MDNETIYTIGHSNIEINKFINLLKQKGIEMVVDVRSAPYSKYVPWFNRNNIEIELKKEGIAYIFMGDVLGGRPKQLYDNEFYTADLITDIKYKKIMEQEWYQKGIFKLIEIAKMHKTVIMCSEENPEKCHRHLLISQSLIDKGVNVKHIRGNGNIEIAKRHILQTTLV